VANWAEAVRLTTQDESSFDGVYSSITPHRRIKSSEVVEVFKMTNYSDLAKAFHVEMNTDRVKYEICYCSVYEDCWRTVYGEQLTHQTVSKCEI
jgi:hypothetical protein